MKTLLLLFLIAGSTFLTGNQTFGQCSGPINYSNDSTGGTFNDPNDWSGLVAPSPANQCVIKTGLPMSLATTYSMNGSNCLIIEAGTSLNLASGSSLDFSGSYTIINNGTISGDGVLSIGSGCTLVNNGNVSAEVVNSGTINGTGTINVTAGKTFTISNTSNNFVGNKIYNYGTINILSSVTIDSLTYNYGAITVGNNATITYDGYMYGGGTLSLSNGGDVINNGIMNGVTDIIVNAGSQFTNQPGGEVLWLSGTIAALHVSGSGAIFTNNGFMNLNRDIYVSNSGTLNNTGTATLTGLVQIGTASSLTNSGSFGVSGPWTISGNSILTNSGTLNTGSLGISGSSVTNPGTLNTGSVTITASSVSQTGIINTIGDFTLSSLSAPFVNQGTLSVTGHIPVNANISLINHATGVIRGGAAGARLTVSGANAVFTNNGSMTGIRDLYLSSAGSVSNSGTTSLTGLLSMTGSTLTNSGTLGLSGTWSIAGSSSVTNPGTFNTGAVTISASTVSQTGTINTTGDFTLSSLSAPFVNQGTLSVTGHIPVNANISLINHATGVIRGGAAGARLTVSGANALFTNNGSMTGIRDLYLSSAGAVNNTGTTSLTGLLSMTGSTLTNTGTLGLSGTWSITGSSSVTNPGTLNTGSVTITASTVSQTGTINTTGDFTLSSLSAPFVNQGTMATTGNIIVNSNISFINNASALINGGTTGARLTVSGSNALFTNNGSMTGIRDLYISSGGRINNIGTTSLSGLLSMSGSTLTNSGTLGLSGTWSITASSSVTNSGTLNTGSVTIDGSTVAHTGTINTVGDFSLSNLPAPFNNPSVISVTGNLSVNTSNGGSAPISTFVNQATGVINGGAAGARLTVTGANGAGRFAYFNNYGALTGTRDIHLSNKGTFNNYSTFSLTGLLQMNKDAFLVNSGTMGLSGTWNISNNSSVTTTGTLNTGPITLASSTFTVEPTGIVNTNGEFALNTGPCQLNINTNGTTYGSINVSSFRVNSGSFNNRGEIDVLTGDFTNNSSSTVYNNHNIFVRQGNFSNSTDFVNNGPVPPATGIILSSTNPANGNFSNSGTFHGTAGYTECTGYSRNFNGGIMSGTQVFCDLGYPPGGIDRNDGSVGVNVLGCKWMAPLPVTLVTFEGKLADKKVVLNWTTSEEKNSDKFIIERAGTSMDFKALGEVKSAGTTKNIQKYDFIDATGLDGIAYYRLKMVDLDGTFKYSKVISVSGKILAGMEVYPNPTAGAFTIKAPQEIVNGELEIVNVTGAVVYRQHLSTKKLNDNLEINFSGEKPRPGLYMVRITKDGNLILSPQSIIIK